MSVNQPTSAPSTIIHHHGFRAMEMNEQAVAGHRIRYAEVAISIFDFGGSKLLFGDRVELIQPKQMHLHWGAVPHQPLEHVNPSRFWVVTFPMGWFLSWDLPKEFSHHILRGGFVREPDPKLGDWDCSIFARWTEDLSGSVDWRRRAAILEIRARVERLAHSVNLQSTGNNASTATSGVSSGERLDKMLRFISQRYVDPISVSDIAEAAGIHPNSAMRLFRQTWGMSLWSFVTEYRVWQAQLLLATTELKVSEIARRSGFGSEAQFYTAMKGLTGKSPAVYRRQLHG